MSISPGRPGGAGKSSKQFTFRERIIRVERAGRKHRYVVFGRPVPRPRTRTRVLRHYLTLRDAQYAQEHGLTSVGLPTVGEAMVTVAQEPEHFYRLPDVPERLSVDDLFAKLEPFDVVSFDIFDTALHRTVASPSDVFRLMAAELAAPEFPRIRKDAEGYARVANYRAVGNREVTLDEIYEVLAVRYGVDPSWQAIEEAIEIAVSRPNPHIKAVYDLVLEAGKTVVFTTDMYLPRRTIEALLAHNSFGEYDRLFLSSEHGKRKGDGSLQPVVLEAYSPGRKVIHIGDSLHGDVLKSEAVGLPAVHNPDQRRFRAPRDTDTIAGSFYNAVINNRLGSGTWNPPLHYTHGFRVGGILAVGYVEHIERLARERGIEKILFCGRDCDVISEVYTRFYGSVPSAYVDTSRYALLGITLDKNFQEYIERSFFRWMRDAGGRKTIAELFTDCGFDYLIPHLAEADIEQFLFPIAGSPATLRRRLEQFFWANRGLIEQHNEASRDAATAYFARAVDGAQRVLVVDIGWAGTSARTLRQFFASSLPEAHVEVLGTLMCTSRASDVADSISAGQLDSYIYSPMSNMDLTRLMMPSGAASARVTDVLHHALEYLFTEPSASVTGYAFGADGSPVAVRGDNAPDNIEQILEMQAGVLDFAAEYLAYSSAYSAVRPVTPYVAFAPLRETLENPEYSYLVYKDFDYDAAPTPFVSGGSHEKFGMLYDQAGLLAAPSVVPKTGPGPDLGKILFISPEMIYAGAPRSLLRLTKVAASLGYEPIVWTGKPGPFAREFEAAGFSVHVVDFRDVTAERVRQLKSEGVRLVVSNTVVTDAYVRRFEGRLPVVWYIREATNLPDFIRASERRALTLRQSRSIYCVSEYAATAIGEFANGPIGVVRNAVEDRAPMAQPYQPRAGGKHRFVQLGTIEQRKGYDLFVAAYKSMPADYRARSELHFAGGFVNSGATFASYLFGATDGAEGITYHGLITNERDKIDFLARMDTVVVASRDESCSLVALEGAMLSKPLVVTTNVGAKYMVDGQNGEVVESGVVDDLRNALMRQIDADVPSLLAMGEASRRSYEARASMEVHREELGDLFASRIAAGAGERLVIDIEGADARQSGAGVEVASDVVVSLTSFPERIGAIGPCVDSLRAQSLSPRAIVLWLSRDQFPGGDEDLPAELLARTDSTFCIEWVDGDIGPHKKYLYAMQRFPGAVIVTVDDDAVYGSTLLKNLYQTHLEYPRAIVCDRANLILFRPDGRLREYDGWVYDYNHLRGVQTYQLLPTGLGGVLYPPGSLPEVAFDVDVIAGTSLRADDLWLKFMATANGYPVVMPSTRSGHTLIDDAQAVGLWRANAFQGGNDAAIERILQYFDSSLGGSAPVLRRIRGVGDHGDFVGPRATDFERLI